MFLIAWKLQSWDITELQVVTSAVPEWLVQSVSEDGSAALPYWCCRQKRLMYLLEELQFQGATFSLADLTLWLLKVGEIPMRAK